MNLKTTLEKIPPSLSGLWALAMVLLAANRTQAQNSCGAAQNIGPGTYVVTAIDGTYTGSPCATGASMAEWYKYTPTQNYSVTVTSDLAVNTCKDTRFYVYTGTCAQLVCLTNDDDGGNISCGSNNNTSYLSTKTFDVEAGVTYYIAWDNRWNTNGFTFQLIQSPFVPSPCFTASPISAGTHTVAAVDGANVNTACSTATQGKWYKYVPTADWRVTVTSDLPQNLCKDTNFSVYTGSCSNGLSCVASDDNAGLLQCNSGNTNSNLSRKTFDVTAGTVYYIVWDNKWSASGFDFQLSEEEIVIPIEYNTQTIAGISGGYNMCVVDVNGDGLDDMVGVDNNNMRVHYQQNGGTFNIVDIPVTGQSLMPGWSLAAADYNGDGFTDLLLGNGSGVTFWKSNSTGTAYTAITPGQYIFCQRTNFVDINNDGNLDAFSCHDIAPNCWYLNDGSANANMSYFQSSGTTQFGNVGGNYASIWTDYDNDGDVDLFVSKCSGPPSELHRNNGDGTFTDVANISGLNFTPVSSWSSAVFDYDNDGDMDILIGSNGFVGSRLFRNDLGGGTPDMFTDVTAGSGWDTDSSTNRDYIAYDFDNNGYVDVMGGGDKIMFNQGDGSFIGTPYPGLGVGSVGDLNNDGFLDIQNGNTVRYGVPNGNKWFKVTVQGNQSNNDGIGARVEIHGDFGIQVREIRAGEGFEFMSTLNAHFGLGAATAIESVVITWPSGIVDTIDNPAINSALNVVEGSTLSTRDVEANLFRIYPNPTQDTLTITGHETASLEAVQVVDLLGRSVLNPPLEGHSISVRSLSPGTYVLLIKTTDGKTFNRKFLKK
ncbi:FG-GAP-like repeat-containing protein [Flavobacterium selenitireducens]|uniref:FG-GAP-like repeat-containing protein n=1 Tax=Flavobacterium selenitireducens TaxID=2722704 RepID=UPI00168BB682|nr:FG-GAP-like repeat-containing protein [Flavobacterium selenitireducens]MBD3583858.1 T9SS type A sorting domain-containing protein [Flavobacterium selenitireducens]